MIPVEQFHIRVMFLFGAVGVLVLLRKPLRYPDKPGSKGFVVLVGALSLWLGSSGLSYFVPDLRATLVLYNFILFGIMVSCVGWLLIAVEFATQRFPSRRLLYGLGAIVTLHFLVLWTNFFWVHELMYQSTTTVDNAVLDPDRGSLFWIHSAASYGLILFATVLLAAEWVNASGLRRRQAAILLTTPAIGMAFNLVWLAGLVDLSFDPTPIGTTAGVVLLSYALFRAEFLDLAPIGRQTVVEEMTDAVVILDDRNRVVDWNRAAQELFSVQSPAVGMLAKQFFEPVPDETLANVSQSDETEIQVSFELDGRTRYFSVLRSQLDVGEAEPRGRVLVIRDVTALKRREQQLMEQNQYLDEFAGVVSHDLQGPLMEIRATASLIANTGDPDHVDSVLDATDRMEHLVDDLLELARTGQQISDPEPVVLADVTSSAWQRVWGPDADLVVETEETIVADPDRLQQLLENLFQNCIEHGSTDSATSSTEPEPTSGRLAAGGGVEHTFESVDQPADGVEHSVTESTIGSAVTTTDRRPADGADVTVTVGSLEDGFYVEDDGPGIPPAKREAVFDRGYTTSAEGTGLGLGIVRQIAGAHGWSVQVTEGAEGGARFEIRDVDTCD